MRLLCTKKSKKGGNYIPKKGRTRYQQRLVPQMSVRCKLSKIIDTYYGDDPIYVVYPERIAAAARNFLDGFRGRTLYAVKANPHPIILKKLWDEGIRHFDVASLREVMLIHRLFNGNMYLMHPVKSRILINTAFNIGVRDFSFDSVDEFYKIRAETNKAKSITLHLRVALQQNDSVMPLSGKFGANFNDSVELLSIARSAVGRLGLSFHVGSQCLNCENYRDAIAYVRRIVDTARVEIDVLDVGGGFPVNYSDISVPILSKYFDVIHNSLDLYGFGGIDAMSEPGRAMVAEGGATLARVELRKGDCLYLNDGVYGSLFDAAQFNWKYPVELHRRTSMAPSSDMEEFRLFGPTCDAYDALPRTFRLPADVKEGDWIEFKHLGAYGQTLSTRFNGFYSENVVCVF